MIWQDGTLTHPPVLGPAASRTRQEPAIPPRSTRQALLDSVAHHFVSDVPVGVFLSGGIDSTAIVALARPLRAGELRTFSLAFPGSPLDEGPRCAANRGALRHHASRVGA